MEQLGMKANFVQSTLTDDYQLINSFYKSTIGGIVRTAFNHFLNPKYMFSMFAQDCWLVGQENIDNIEFSDADRGDINNNYKVDSATSEVLDVY